MCSGKGSRAAGREGTGTQMSALQGRVIARAVLASGTSLASVLSEGLETSKTWNLQEKNGSITVSPLQHPIMDVNGTRGGRGRRRVILGPRPRQLRHHTRTGRAVRSRQRWVGLLDTAKRPDSPG